MKTGMKVAILALVVGAIIVMMGASLGIMTVGVMASQVLASKIVLLGMCTCMCSVLWLIWDMVKEL